MDLAKELHQSVYLRERLQPQAGDGAYLHLADLRQALSGVATDRPMLLLDYGCGGSPYRSLFPNASYRRADFLQEEGDHLDYVLSSDSHVNEADETFDFILSTQVLEHVGSPQGYISECYRLLKSGGELYLTTHGSYPDHACPYDYFRWTADGLIRELERAGFTISRVEKHTTGPRALMFQMDILHHSLRTPLRNAFGILTRIFCRIYPKLKPWLHKMSDVCFTENRVVTKDLYDHASYITIGCLARKPQ